MREVESFHSWSENDERAHHAQLEQELARTRIEVPPRRPHFFARLFALRLDPRRLFGPRRIER
jgi:hypothetical protein